MKIKHARKRKKAKYKARHGFCFDFLKICVYIRIQNSGVRSYNEQICKNV
jgi:hypothetical protein